MRTKSWILLAAIAVNLGGSMHAFAMNMVSFEFGLNDHAGASSESFSGSYGYSFGYKAQSSGMFRVELGGQAEFTKGTVKFATGDAEVQNIRILGVSGVSINPFYRNKISPFFGFSGLAGFGAFQSDPPPLQVGDSKTQYLFGYESFIGMDYARRGDNKLRFRIALRSMATTYDSKPLLIDGIIGYLSYVFPGM